MRAVIDHVKAAQQAQRYGERRSEHSCQGDAVDTAGGGALAGLRVLEVAGTLGEYAGKLLADFGADVVLVEPPAGAARLARLGPFIDDGRERSAASASPTCTPAERGITLDLDQDEGQSVFARLARVRPTSCWRRGTGQPGLMTRRGLGYDALAAGRPGLVYTAVTPFSCDGPYAGYQATNLTLMAMGGLLSLGGYADGQPVPAGGDQACLAAGQFAAVGTLLAVLAAEESGTGQFVDVSAQQAVVMAHENAVQYYDLEKVIRRRNGGDVRQAAVGMYRCSDGYVYLLAKGLGESGNSSSAGSRPSRWRERPACATRSGGRRFASSPEGKARTFAEMFRPAGHAPDQGGAVARRPNGPGSR